jgi:hypothetical protein
LGSAVAAIAKVTPTAATMSVQTISTYAFTVRIRFIVMFFSKPFFFWRLNPHPIRAER